MGRASRKISQRWTAHHPDRLLWTPEQAALAEGMSQAAYEALYGRGGRVESGSRFMPAATGEFLQSKRRGYWWRHEIADFLSREEAGANWSALREDPLLDVIWDQEWRGVVASLQKMGAGRALSVLQRRRKEIEEYWKDTITGRLKEESYVYSIGEAPLSLYAMILGDELGLSKYPRPEIIHSMAVMSERREWADFAHRSLLPALKDMPHPLEVREEVDDAWIIAASRAVRALWGDDYANRVREGFVTLANTQHFRGSASLSSAYTTLLRQLAGYYGHSLRGDPSQPSSWRPLSDDEHASVMRTIVSLDMGALAHDQEKLDLFLESQLGQSVTRSLALENPGDDIPDIARHFSEEIYDSLLSGQVDAGGAWREAFLASRSF